MRAELVGLISGEVITEREETGLDALARLVDWFSQQGSQYECIIYDDDDEVIYDLFP